jgi:3-oxoacyl-[acyl-carrier-protein] synthase III
MILHRSKILGTGSYLPERIITNDELAARIETSHQWIVERTGIHQRRISDLSKGESPSGMAKEAALRAIKNANLTPNDIDMILVSATLPDQTMPNTASVLQEKLGISNLCPALDVNAACSGWIYLMPMADAMIKTGLYKNILVVGSEMLSSFNNWDDRNTCILFGDASGAVVLGRSQENEDSCFYSSVLTCDSTKKDHLTLLAGGAVKRITKEIIDNNEHWMTMNGQQIFKSAVTTMAAHAEKVVKDAGLSMDQIDWFIPHQANLRIIEAVGNRFNIPMEKVIINVDKYANTSSASVPVALDEAIRSGKIKRGDNLLMAAFGAGLTAGALCLKY